VTNRRETGECRKRRGNAGINIKATHHVLTVITERPDPSLVTQGCVGDNLCLVTVDTEAYVTVTRPDITVGWPERAEPTLQGADGIWGNPPHLEGSFPDTDPGATPTENMSIRRRYHKRVHLVAEYPARIRIIC
jgi:hypothetical protein